MTYIELMNRFWEANQKQKFSDVETIIYFFLLNECNLRRWQNPFELQTRYIEISLGYSRKTIGAARKNLKERGFLDLVDASGRGATAYLINGSKVTNEALFERFCVSGCVSPGKHKVEKNTVCVSSEKHKSNKNAVCVSPEKHKDEKNAVCVSGCVSPEKHKGNTNADYTYLIEDIRYKDIERSSPARARTKSTGSKNEGCLFSKAELKKTEPKGVRACEFSEFKPPTLEEVRRCFLRLDADKRLDNWEDSAQRFYDNFTAVDWYDKFNRRIKRWENRASLWITDDETKQKQNEQSQTDRQSAPSRGVPFRGKIVPGCGLKRRDPPGKE